jgi:hypothetical protein
MSKDIKIKSFPKEAGKEISKLLSADFRQKISLDKLIVLGRKARRGFDRAIALKPRDVGLLVSGCSPLSGKGMRTLDSRA